MRPGTRNARRAHRSTVHPVNPIEIDEAAYSAEWGAGYACVVIVRDVPDSLHGNGHDLSAIESAQMRNPLSVFDPGPFKRCRLYRHATTDTTRGSCSAIMDLV